MDYQYLFNLAVTLAAFLGGFLLNRIMRLLDRLDGDVRAMPQNYVSKDDYRQDIREMKDIMQRIFDKLEGKVDK